MPISSAGHDDLANPAETMSADHHVRPYHGSECQTGNAYGAAAMCLHICNAHCFNFLPAFFWSCSLNNNPTQGSGRCGETVGIAQSAICASF